MRRAKPLPPDQRRAAIIKATRPLLLAHGGQFTTRQVAEAANIAEGTIFRVFTGKDELLGAVIDDILDTTDTIKAITALPSGQDLQERVKDLVTILHNGIGEAAALFTALHAMPPTDTERHFGSSHRKGEHRHRERTEELHDALCQSLQPYAAQLRASVAQTASFIRSVATATAHPLLSDGRVSDPALIAAILTNGLHRDSTCTVSE